MKNVTNFVSKTFVKITALFLVMIMCIGILAPSLRGSGFKTASATETDVQKTVASVIAIHTDGSENVTLSVKADAGDEVRVVCGSYDETKTAGSEAVQFTFAPDAANIDIMTAQDGKVTELSLGGSDNISQIKLRESGDLEKLDADDCAGLIDIDLGSSHAKLTDVACSGCALDLHDLKEICDAIPGFDGTNVYNLTGFVVPEYVSPGYEFDLTAYMLGESGSKGSSTSSYVDWFTTANGRGPGSEDRDDHLYRGETFTVPDNVEQLFAKIYDYYIGDYYYTNIINVVPPKEDGSKLAFYYKTESDSALPIKYYRSNKEFDGPDMYPSPLPDTLTAESGPEDGVYFVYDDPSDEKFFTCIEITDDKVTGFGISENNTFEKLGYLNIAGGNLGKVDLSKHHKLYNTDLSGCGVTELILPYTVKARIDLSDNPTPVIDLYDDYGSPCCTPEKLTLSNCEYSEIDLSKLYNDGWTYFQYLDISHNLLTDIDVPRSMEYLDVSYNLLESLDLSYGPCYDYINASHNQLSSFTVNDAGFRYKESASKTMDLDLEYNCFTFATLFDGKPRGSSDLGTIDYKYLHQADIVIPETVKSGEDLLDLSFVGADNYTWFDASTNQMLAVQPEEENGVFTFPSSLGGKTVYCEMTSNKPEYVGLTIKTTPTTVIADKTPKFVISYAHAERARFSVASGASIFVDWGDGNVVSCTADESGYISGTAIAGSDGKYTITVYASGDVTGLNVNNCGVTALDVSRCTELKELSCFSSTGTASASESTNNFNVRNEISALDVSENAALEKLYCMNNQLTCASFELPADGGSIDTLNCSGNMLRYSGLPVEISCIADVECSNQQALDMGTDAYEVGSDIDLSAQAEYAGEDTVYEWYALNGSDEVKITEGITPVSGKSGCFTIGDALAEKTVICKMTNSKAQNLLSTSPISVAALPAPPVYEWYVSDNAGILSSFMDILASSSSTFTDASGNVISIRDLAIKDTESEYTRLWLAVRGITEQETANAICALLLEKNEAFGQAGGKYSLFSIDMTCGDGTVPVSDFTGTYSLTLKKPENAASERMLYYVYRYDSANGSLELVYYGEGEEDGVKFDADPSSMYTMVCIPYVQYEMCVNDSLGLLGSKENISALSGTTYTAPDGAVLNLRDFKITDTVSDNTKLSLNISYITDQTVMDGMLSQIKTKDASFNAENGNYQLIGLNFGQGFNSADFTGKFKLTAKKPDDSLSSINGVEPTYNIYRHAPDGSIELVYTGSGDANGIPFEADPFSNYSMTWSYETEEEPYEWYIYDPTGMLKNLSSLAGLSIRDSKGNLIPLDKLKITDQPTDSTVFQLDVSSTPDNATSSKMLGEIQAKNSKFTPSSGNYKFFEFGISAGEETEDSVIRDVLGAFDVTLKAPDTAPSNATYYVYRHSGDGVEQVYCGKASDNGITFKADPTSKYSMIWFDAEDTTAPKDNTPSGNKADSGKQDQSTNPSNDYDSSKNVAGAGDGAKNSYTPNTGDHDTTPIVPKTGDVPPAVTVIAMIILFVSAALIVAIAITAVRRKIAKRRYR